MAEEPSDWEEYQQNEIDAVWCEVKERWQHIENNYQQNGILDGEFVGGHHNERLESYLQGYADALYFAAEEIERIDNLAVYAYEAGAEYGGEE